MKKWLALIGILAIILIPYPVQAIGVSPYSVSFDLQAGSSYQVEFTIHDSNQVRIYLEDLPFSVEDEYITVINNKILVQVNSNISVSSGNYEGYIVIVESGNQIGAGVKVKTFINYMNNSVRLSATIISPYYYSGGGGYVVWEQSSPQNTTENSLNNDTAENNNDSSSSQNTPSPDNSTSENYYPVEEDKGTNWGLVVFIIAIPIIIIATIILLLLL